MRSDGMISRRLIKPLFLACAAILMPAHLAKAAITEQANQAPLQEMYLSLRTAMAAAAEQNPSILLSRERVEAARGEVTTQLGAMLPNVSANVRESQQTQFLGTFGLAPVRTAPFSIFDARVSASQNLFSLSLIQRWRASREALQVAEFDAQSSRYDTMASTGLAYLEGVRAASALTMRRANQQLIRELLSMAKVRQKEGSTTGLDVARLEGQLANEQQQVVTAQADLERAKTTLGNLLGLTFEVRMTLTEQFAAQVQETASLQAAWEQALTNRPEVQAQAKRLRSAELSYSSVTGERLPSLVAQGDTGLIGNRWNNSLDTYNMALLLQVPLFDGGQREGRVSTARSQLKQEAFRLKVVLNQVRAEINEARIALGAARDKAGLLRLDSRRLQKKQP